jgi:hypothetical protein
MFDVTEAGHEDNGRKRTADDDAAVRRPGRRLVIQPKMIVGTVDDPAEREADAIADQTVRRLAAATTAPPQVDRTSDRVRRAPARVQADDLGGLPASADVEARIQRAAGSGTPLDGTVRRQFQSAMGADLGAVRIHRSPEADRLNTDLRAKAFTAGNDVFFSSGSYAPTSRDGQHLLAHELAHTVQQQPRVRRQVIRRFSLASADFTKTTSVNVFQKGGSGNVAEFSDGGTPLIVKVDQLIGNEVVAAGNLHAASAQQSGGSGGFSVNAPGSRLATAKERTDIATATTALLKPTDSPRNFLTGMTSSKPVVIMEKSGGKDFSDVLADGGHTKKGLFGKAQANNKSIVFQIATVPGPLTTLGQALPVDVVMGMYDRLIGYYNADNFRYDESNQSFGFVDNTQNGEPGFITSVDIGGIFTNKESFDSWAKGGHVKNLIGNTAALAQTMFDTFIGIGNTSGMAVDLDGQGEVGALFRAAVKKNQSKMLGWIKAGIDTGKRSVMSQLANPMQLVNGIGDAQKPEAVQSLLAKLYVLQGKAPAVAWADAGLEAQRLLPPKVVAKATPWMRATPNKGPAPTGTGATGATGATGGGSTWKSAQPTGKWKSAQPTGKWKRATPSNR